MIKKFLYIVIFFLLSNCSMSGTAFLGPVFTGAKTGSVYQSSLSFSSGRIVNHLKDNEIIEKLSLNNSLIKTNKIPQNIKFINKTPQIIIAYKVEKIEFSEVLEPEPLP